MTALNRKLLRDLWAMKTQAAAIALVVAAGVAMYVMYLSNLASLRATRDAFYERQRFADVFATLKRAPRHVATAIAAMDGVTAAEPRIVAATRLDLPGVDEPASGLLISIPGNRRPAVNDLFVRQGRWVDPSRDGEVIASEGFVTANRLAPGSRVDVIVNGRLRALTIVGVALSPEYVYSVRPGEMVPDDRRYGIFWMEEQELAGLFDMTGAFNDISLRLAPGTLREAVITDLDERLARYGGRGALPRDLQMSHWMLDNELNQLQTIGFLLPGIFLVVAAFILNVALTRALALQRPQIAALKALGYGNRVIGWHYLQVALLIGVAGIVIGAAGGAWLGSGMIGMYNKYFRFPQLQFSIAPSVLLVAATVTLVASCAGAFSAVRRAVRIPPAEAMRPDAPSGYGRSIFEVPLLARRLGAAGRMVLRNIGRHPLRAAAVIFGIAFAVAVLMMGFIFIDATEHLIENQFWSAERQDVTVSFLEPTSAAARHAMARLPGVLAVEPQRAVAARVRAGHRHRYVSVAAVPPQPRLRRIIDRDARLIHMPASGAVVSRMLAEVLGVGIGQPLTIEFLEGERPTRTVSVNGIVDDVLGLSVYVNADELHAMLREDAVLTGALLTVDSRDELRLTRALKATPAVAGAGFKRHVLDRFRETMAANINLTTMITVVFAAIIAFGVVYNAARVSLSERSRELASLRVLGFTRAEISLILLAELAVLTALALPIGAVFGYALWVALIHGMDSEVFRFPVYVTRSAVARTCIGIIAAAAVSGLVVRRRLDHLDLVAVLKIPE